jgi:putative ABC transport system permease protein
MRTRRGPRPGATVQTLSNLVYFYRRRFRARRVQELFALIGIAVGVALLFAVQVSSTSLSASVERLTESFFGRAQWQLVARGSHGLDERVVSRLERSGDVQTAAPVLEVAASVAGRRMVRSVTLVAADQRVETLGGPVLRGNGGLLSSLRTLALPASVAHAVGVGVGDTATLQISGRAVRVPGVATLTRDQFGTLADTPIVVSFLRSGQVWAGMPGRVSRVYVRARPGREQQVERLLQRVAAGRADVRRVDFDEHVFAQAALPNDQSTGLFAAISAAVGFLFAFTALLLIAQQRRELVAALRRWGFGARSVIRILLFDALLLGLLASVAGLGLGEILSRVVFPPSPGYLALAFPVGVGRVVEWQTTAIAIGAGITAAVLATLVPLRSQLSGRRLKPDDDGLHEHGAGRVLRSRWGLVGGLACLGLAAVLPVSAPGAAVVGILALIASMLLCLPWLLMVVLAGVDRFGRWRSSTIPVLAVGSLRSSTSRTVAVAAIAGIALLAVVAIEGSHRDLQHGLDADVHQLSAVSDLWVSAAGASNTLATTAFDQGVARRIEHLRDVASVHVQRGGFLDIGNRRVWVLAPPREARQPVPTSQILAGGAAQTTARLRGHGWAAVSQALADAQHLHIGQTFTLQAPRPTKFRLAAIISNLGWTPGTIVINADDYRTAWQSSDASALRVDLRPATGRLTGKRLVQQALGAGSGLTVETAREREQRQRATARQALSRLTQIAYLVLGAAALAMAASMGAMILQRKRELAGVKLLGIQSHRVLKMLLLETLILLGTGCTAGTVYGLYGARLLDGTLTRVTGFPVEASLALPVALASYLALSATAFTFAAIASRNAARVPPRTAFQD